MVTKIVTFARLPVTRAAPVVFFCCPHESACRLDCLCFLYRFYHYVTACPYKLCFHSTLVGMGTLKMRDVKMREIQTVDSGD